MWTACEGGFNVSKGGVHVSRPKRYRRHRTSIGDSVPLLNKRDVFAAILTSSDERGLAGTDKHAQRRTTFRRDVAKTEHLRRERVVCSHSMIWSTPYRGSPQSLVCSSKLAGNLTCAIFLSLSVLVILTSF